MSSATWTVVDHYVEQALVASDPVLESVLAACDAAGLPAINVSPSQGKFLQLFASIQGATRILEIGTLGGYSTIWLARALPESGRLVTLEFDPRHAEVARGNFARAGLSDIIEMRVGPALQTLPMLAAEGGTPFDFLFIDADKANNPGYFEWAMKLTRRGSVIIVDNVIREGRVIDETSTDPNILGIRRMNEMIAAEPRVSATAIQTVGAKGYDGLAVILVISD